MVFWEGDIHVFFVTQRNANEGGIKTGKEIVFGIEKEPLILDFLEVLWELGLGLGEWLTVDRGRVAEDDNVSEMTASFSELERLQLEQVFSTAQDPYEALQRTA